ncbi:MAG TPA: hypothetical protein VKB19_12755 [Pedobacter sp.]|nr:hypothetical protein [Pedobacter sp.]
MDLQQEWNNMNNELSNQSQSFAPDKIEIQKSSKNAYMNLLKMFRAKLNWITALSLPMLVGAIFAEGLLKYLLLAMFVCYQLLRIVMSRKMNQLPNYIDYTSVTKNFIATQLDSMRTLLLQEKIWGYCFGPLAVPFSYMCLKAYQYKSFDQIVAHEPNMLYIMLGLALFVFPINYLAEKATKKAFGNDIEKLTGHLEVLEEIDQ